MKIEQIPENLYEAVDFIYASLSPGDIEYIKHDTSGSQHMWLGRKIRNDFKLWEPDAILVKWFTNNLKIGHPDDMSGLILSSLRAKASGQILDLDAEVARYHAHWAEQKVDPVSGKLL
jgi:hypothetical protein